MIPILTALKCYFEITISESLRLWYLEILANNSKVNRHNQGYCISSSKSRISRIRQLQSLQNYKFCRNFLPNRIYEFSLETEFCRAFECL